MFPLLPPIVGGVGHVLDGECVTGEAVPREATQHCLDGTVLGLLNITEIWIYLITHYISQQTILLLSLSSFIFLAIAW